MFAGQNVQDRGVFTRPFIFGLILLLLFLTATTEMGPPPQRPSSVTLAGSQANPEGELRDELVYKLSVANAQLEKENRRMRLHLLDLRKIVRDCKGVNFTTDLQRVYHLSDLNHLRGPGSKQHPQKRAAGEQLLLQGQQEQGQQQNLQEDSPTELGKQRAGGSDLPPAYNGTIAQHGTSSTQD